MILKQSTRSRLSRRLPWWVKQYQLLWWLEIKTAKPSCIYYFGPFDSRQEARLHQDSYVEDLVKEQAEGISIKLKKCQPQKLTICSDQ